MRDPDRVAGIRLVTDRPPREVLAVPANQPLPSWLYRPNVPAWLDTFAVPAVPVTELERARDEGWSPA